MAVLSAALLGCANIESSSPVASNENAGAITVTQFTTYGKPTKMIETLSGSREIYDPLQDVDVTAAFQDIYNKNQYAITSSGQLLTNSGNTIQDRSATIIILARNVYLKAITAEQICKTSVSSNCFTEYTNLCPDLANKVSDNCDDGVVNSSPANDWYKTREEYYRLVNQSKMSSLIPAEAILSAPSETGGGIKYCVLKNQVVLSSDNTLIGKNSGKSISEQINSFFSYSCKQTNTTLQSALRLSH